MRRLAHSSLLFALLALALGLAACGSSGKADGGPSTIAGTAAPVVLSGGSTTLAIDPQTAGLLEDNSIALGDVAPASFGADAVSFPITSGKLDATSLGGSVTHRGGLRISVGAVSVALRDLVVDTKAQQVTALVGHGRMPIFDLDQRQLSGSVSGGQLTGTGAVALLTPRAASALNAALSVSVFTPKLIFGDVTIDAKTA